MAIMVRQSRSQKDVWRRTRAWQIILKDSLLFSSFIPKFSAHYSFKPAHYSSIILKQHCAASAKLNCHDLGIEHM